MPYMHLRFLNCGNLTHNLEVVSTPKPTTITMFLAMSIFSQSRLGVCEQLAFYPGQLLVSHVHTLQTSSQTSTTTRLSHRVLAGVLLFTPPIDILGVCLHSPVAAIPSIPLVSSASQANWASVTTPNLIVVGFRLHHIPVIFCSLVA